MSKEDADLQKQYDEFFRNGGSITKCPTKHGFSPTAWDYLYLHQREYGTFSDAWMTTIDPKKKALVYLNREKKHGSNGSITYVEKRDARLALGLKDD